MDLSGEFATLDSVVCVEDVLVVIFRETNLRVCEKNEKRWSIRTRAAFITRLDCFTI